MSIIGAVKGHGIDSSIKRYNVISKTSKDSEESVAFCLVLDSINGVTYTPKVEDVILASHKSSKASTRQADKVIMLNGASVNVSDLDDLTVLRLLVHCKCQNRNELPEVCDC